MCFPGKRDDFVCHYIYFGPGFLCLSFSLYPLVSGGVVLPLVFSFFAYTLTFTSAKGTKKGLGHSPPTEFRAVIFGSNKLRSQAHEKALKALPYFSISQ